MPKKMTVKSAFKEMKKNPPAILAKTKAKKGKKAAQKQKIAIALSKAGKSKRK